MAHRLLLAFFLSLLCLPIGIVHAAKKGVLQEKLEKQLEKQFENQKKKKLAEAVKDLLLSDSPSTSGIEYFLRNGLSYEKQTQHPLGVLPDGTKAIESRRVRVKLPLDEVLSADALAKVKQLEKLGETRRTAYFSEILKSATGEPSFLDVFRRISDAQKKLQTSLAGSGTMGERYLNVQEVDQAFNGEWRNLTSGLGQDPRVDSLERVTDPLARRKRGRISSRTTPEKLPAEAKTLDLEEYRAAMLHAVKLERRRMVFEDFEELSSSIADYNRLAEKERTRRNATRERNSARDPQEFYNAFGFPKKIEDQANYIQPTLREKNGVFSFLPEYTRSSQWNISFDETNGDILVENRNSKKQGILEGLEMRDFQRDEYTNMEVSVDELRLSMTTNTLISGHNAYSLADNPLFNDYIVDWVLRDSLNDQLYTAEDKLRAAMNFKEIREALDSLDTFRRRISTESSEESLEVIRNSSIFHDRALEWSDKRVFYGGLDDIRSLEMHSEAARSWEPYDEFHPRGNLRWSKMDLGDESATSTWRDNEEGVKRKESNGKKTEKLSGLLKSYGMSLKQAVQKTFSGLSQKAKSEMLSSKAKKRAAVLAQVVVFSAIGLAAIPIELIDMYRNDVALIDDSSEPTTSGLNAKKAPVAFELHGQTSSNYFYIANASDFEEAQVRVLPSSAVESDVELIGKKVFSSQGKLLAIPSPPDHRLDHLTLYEGKSRVLLEQGKDYRIVQSPKGMYGVELKRPQRVSFDAAFSKQKLPQAPHVEVLAFDRLLQISLENGGREALEKVPNYFREVGMGLAAEEMEKILSKPISEITVSDFKELSKNTAYYTKALPKKLKEEPFEISKENPFLSQLAFVDFQAQASCADCDVTNDVLLELFKRAYSGLGDEGVSVEPRMMRSYPVSDGTLAELHGYVALFGNYNSPNGSEQLSFSMDVDGTASLTPKGALRERLKARDEAGRGFSLPKILTMLKNLAARKSRNFEQAGEQLATEELAESGPKGSGAPERPQYPEPSRKIVGRTEELSLFSELRELDAKLATAVGAGLPLPEQEKTVETTKKNLKSSLANKPATSSASEKQFKEGGFSEEYFWKEKAQLKLDREYEAINDLGKKLPLKLRQQTLGNGLVRKQFLHEAVDPVVRIVRPLLEYAKDTITIEELHSKIFPKAKSFPGSVQTLRNIENSIHDAAKAYNLIEAQRIESQLKQRRGTTSSSTPTKAHHPNGARRFASQFSKGPKAREAPADPASALVERVFGGADTSKPNTMNMLLEILRSAPRTEFETADRRLEKAKPIKNLMKGCKE